MSILHEIDQAVADLQTVVDAGLLSDLKESIAFTLRGQPRSDYDAYPGLRRNVDEFAGLLGDFTGLPLQLCRLAALDQLLPHNRNRQSLEVLHEFAERIREQETKRQAASIINTARTGRRAS